MNILKAYKRTRVFLWINIVGLAIGLASSIMLILFVTNELSYDKHFEDSERIVSLNTIMELNGERVQLALATRKALTDIPQKVPGIEAATQVYNMKKVDLKYEENSFLNVPAFMTESSFFDVFSLDFIEGEKDVLNVPYSLILAEKYANLIYGNATNAMGKSIKIGDQTYTVAGVIKDLPLNTHFRIGVLLSMEDEQKSWPSVEFYTFYKLKKNIPLEDVRQAIEKEYITEVAEFFKEFGAKAEAKTEKLTEIYLKGQSVSTLGEKSSMEFVWMLVVIAIFILSLAIINFVNLFIAQGETRMLEIGVRKANGATAKDISQKFLNEIVTIVFLSFVIGFVLLWLLTPYFSELINRQIDLAQLYNPFFVLSTIVLFAATVILSAFYPTIYLSKFKTLDILTKKIYFSKRRLTAISITLQGIVSILIISFILVVNSQTNYLKNQPLGYNPNDVLALRMSNGIYNGSDAIKQELEKQPEIKQVSFAHHLFGGGCSGQGISLSDVDSYKMINEYRIHSGICEMMELQLLEGTFYKEDDPLNKNTIILNEEAVKMLGLNYPVVGKTVNYQGSKQIRGVVKNFYYGQLENPIEPLVLPYIDGGGTIYINYADNISRNQVEQIAHNVLKKFDSDYVVNPQWISDIYEAKFASLNVRSRLLFLASLLSIFISSGGLLAMHILSTIRRKKEIGIRRINGASTWSIFFLLSSSIMKWVLIAGIIAIPIVYYFAVDWLHNFANHVPLHWIIFVFPVILQSIITLAVTSGVTWKALYENPVEVLKSE